MNPLSTFPELLTFGMIAPVLLRLSVGILIIYFGYKRYFKKWNGSSIVYGLTGIFLILGLYTQIAAILGILILKFDFWTDRSEKKVSREYLIIAYLAVVILITLIITGPGFLAFDMPL